MRYKTQTEIQNIEVNVGNLFVATTSSIGIIKIPANMITNQ